MGNGELVGQAPLGIVVAGLSGGSGKSVVSVGITAAFRQMGKVISPFKKGPDYIDAGWLQLAAGRNCYNLDPYLMEPQVIKRSCSIHSSGAELMILEGNRGLFDGVDISGSYSTAELAAILELPVLLVIDCTKTTRTVAAMVLGCQQIDKNVKISGCVLNRIGSNRHESIVRQAIEHYTDVKVVGAVRRQKKDIFPQRHIGITPCPEFSGAATAIESLGGLIAESVDMEEVQNLMEMVSCTDDSENDAIVSESCADHLGTTKDMSALRVGVIKDAAFQFYYPENLSELRRLGAEVVELNALEEKQLPELDGLYIGGGFPETSVRQLAANTSFRQSLRAAIEDGLPVYAECGGLIYLGEGMIVDGEELPLVGVFPVKFTMMAKPQAHGYTILTTGRKNPFYTVGQEIKGHEFRYSKIIDWRGCPDDLAFDMQRGVGFVDGRDGLIYKNVLALYTHIHALGTPQWAEGFMERVKKRKMSSLAT